MQMQFFQVPAVGGEGMVEEVNRFLRTHRVLRVQRELVLRDESPSWAVCVEYLEGAGGSGVGSVSSGKGRTSGRGSEGRVDYKAVLSPEDFALFLLLRDLRRTLAEAEATPVWAVFTNEQLARISQTRPKNRTELEQIDGIGSARSERYGEQVLSIVASAGGAES